MKVLHRLGFYLIICCFDFFIYIFWCWFLTLYVCLMIGFSLQVSSGIGSLAVRIKWGTWTAWKQNKPISKQGKPKKNCEGEIVIKIMLENLIHRKLAEATALNCHELLLRYTIQCIYPGRWHAQEAACPPKDWFWVIGRLIFIKNVSTQKGILLIVWCLYSPGLFLFYFTTLRWSLYVEFHFFSHLSTFKL